MSLLRVERTISMARLLTGAIFLIAFSVMLYLASREVRFGPEPVFLYEPRLDLICYEKAGILACTPRADTGISLETAMGGGR